MKPARLLLCVVATAALLTASCGRSSNEKSADSEGSGGSTSQSSGSSASLLDQGGFGDLKNVCQNGTAKGATAVGVTDTDIHVGTVTDKGSAIRPNLNVEMS